MFGALESLLAGLMCEAVEGAFSAHHQLRQEALAHQLNAVYNGLLQTDLLGPALIDQIALRDCLAALLQATVFFESLSCAERGGSAGH